MPPLSFASSPLCRSLPYALLQWRELNLPWSRSILFAKESNRQRTLLPLRNPASTMLDAELSNQYWLCWQALRKCARSVLTHLNEVQHASPALHLRSFIPCRASAPGRLFSPSRLLQLARTCTCTFTGTSTPMPMQTDMYTAEVCRALFLSQEMQKSACTLSHTRPRAQKRLRMHTRTGWQGKPDAPKHGRGGSGHSAGENEPIRSYIQPKC